LQNQALGIQGMTQANQAGGAQSQLANQDYAGQLTTGAQGAGYQQQAAGVPLAAQQYAAAQPGAAAATYAGQEANITNANQAANAQIIPYINQGQGTSQFNANAQSAQNAATGTALTQGANALATNAGTNGTWLNNLFGGSSSGYNAGVGQAGMSATDQSSIAALNGYGGGV
jgi:hypothetical protein